MAVTVQDFWKLAVASRVVSLDEAKSLHATFARTPGAAKNANSNTVAEWLIDSGVLSRYQAKQLLAGKPGPFLLGEYKIYDQVKSGPLAGLYRAIHSATGQPAMLYLCEQGSADWNTTQQQAQVALTTKYPQAGRVFGMGEAGTQRFLILDDNSGKVALGPAVAAAPVAPQQSAVAARPVAVTNRPVLAPKKEKSGGAVDQPVVIQTTSPAGFVPSPSPMSAYVKRKRSNTPLLIGGALAAVGVLAVAMLLLPSNSSEPKKSPRIASTVKRPTPAVEPRRPTEPEIPGLPLPTAEIAVRPEKPPTPAAEAAMEVADDGQTLWVSPTHGPPIDLRYLANGAQMFLVVRPSSILGSEEGEKAFDALGPRGLAGRDYVEEVTGVQFGEIERFLVAFYPNEGQPIQTAMVVTLREKTTKDALLQAWHNPKEAGKQKKFYQGGAWAYYIPAAGQNRTFSVMPPALMNEMLAMDGPPLLRKELEKMLRDSDETRDVTLLLNPNFLFTDGEAVLSGDMAKLKSPLLDYLGEGVLAASLSFHLTAENFFSELRVWGSLDNNAYDLAEVYRDRLSRLPESIEAYLAELNPQKYGGLILARMPRMIGQLASFSRIGEENSQAVLRCYLPAPAAHNLTLATELALSERPGGTVAVASAGPKKPTTVAEGLKQKISLSFPRNTLEKCMELLAEEIGFPVHIEGADLQLEGITKNQSFGLDERDKPADEILRKVMLLANPDGKLVYAPKPLEAGGKDVVFVTTRAAVAKRGDKLPAELEQEPPKK